MSCCRSSTGRLFHSRGPATPKLLSPRLDCVRGAVHVWTSCVANIMSLGVCFIKTFAWYSVKICVIFGVRFERQKVDKKKHTYTKSETCKLYSRVFWIFLPNFIKIDPYNFQLCCFKAGTFFWGTVYDDRLHNWLTFGWPWATNRVRMTSNGWEASVAKQPAAPPQTKWVTGRRDRACDDGTICQTWWVNSSKLEN